MAMTAAAELTGTPAGRRAAQGPDGMRMPRDRGPVRLTRRGRIAATAASALLIGVTSVALATAAQAAHGGGASRPGGYVTRVVVRPGQSLWSLAEAYDPNEDTRLVIADIEQLNSLTSVELQPGQVLWMPRG